jgi:energy-coupling factor transporter ATP-binding protein EcfA2
MISRLEIANFYCLREPQVIDLRVAANVPDEPGRFAPVWRDAKERAVKVIALFGANASGKSTVLRALAFLSWFVQHSFHLPPDSPQPCERFNDEEARDQPTRLAVRFAGPADLTRATDPATPQCCYSYEVVFGGKGRPQHVLYEALRYWPITTGRQVRLFERKQEGSIAAGKPFGLAGYRSAIQKILRPNASVISTLAQLGHPLSLLARQMAATIISNVFIEKVEIHDDNVARFYAAQPDELQALNREIERIDLGIREVQIQDGANGPVAIFQHHGLATSLPVQFESHGTRAFIRIFPLLNRALITGGIAVIDELDLSIHPLVLPEIIRWFYDTERNPHNAQLWMTCQNASLLEELVKEEVFFGEKDPKGRTTVYGLQDIQAVRRDDNYYRKYLGGLYGAVPRLG